MPFQSELEANFVQSHLSKLALPADLADLIT